MLTEVQIALIGVVVTGVLFALKMWRAAGGQEISTAALKWILFVLSIAMAVFFVLPVFPSFPVLTGDPAEVTSAVVVWVGALVSMGATILGFATLVYAVLTKGVLDNMVARKLDFYRMNKIHRDAMKAKK